MEARAIERSSARVISAPPRDSSPTNNTSGNSLAVFGSRPLVPAGFRPRGLGRGARLRLRRRGRRLGRCRLAASRSGFRRLRGDRRGWRRGLRGRRGGIRCGSCLLLGRRRRRDARQLSGPHRIGILGVGVDGEHLLAGGVRNQQRLFPGVGELPSDRLARVIPEPHSGRQVRRGFTERDHRLVCRLRPLGRDRDERRQHLRVVRVGHMDDVPRREKVGELERIRPGGQRDARQRYRCAERDLRIALPVLRQRGSGRQQHGRRRDAECLLDTAHQSVLPEKSLTPRTAVARRVPWRTRLSRQITESRDRSRRRSRGAASGRVRRSPCI
jgi:hypothetical protein